jgi:hypothetical protein
MIYNNKLQIAGLIYYCLEMPDDGRKLKRVVWQYLNKH